MPSILVTGCSTGIGRATAQLFASRGYRVIATARRPEVLRDLDVDLVLPLDVTDHDSIRNALDRAGDVDVLVNNAGASLWSLVELCPLDDLERMFRTNTLAPFELTQAVLPGMRARGFGRIIQISSNAAHSIGPLLGVYSATKLALEAFSEAARAEVQGFGIDVVVIAMGAVTTNIAQNRTVIDHRGTPYEELVESRLVEMASMRVQPSSAEAVAEVVWEAATTPDPPFRMYVGAGPGAAR